MAKQKQLGIHAVCAMFPEPTREDYERLKNDIRANGVREPVIVLDGELIEGKTRWAICKELKITCPTKKYRGKTDIASLVDYAWSLNGARRHLSTSQKAALVVEVQKLRDADGRLKNADEGAEMSGASKRTVERAMRVARKAPRKMAAIIAGKKSLGKAEEEIAESTPSEPAVIKDELGNEVRGRGPRTAFEAANEFDEIGTEIARVLRRIRALCGRPVGVFLPLQRVEADLTNAKRAVDFAKPYALCPICRSIDGCKACKRQGWLTKELYDLAPVEMKA